MKNTYWHFLPNDGCLRWGTREKVKIKHKLILPTSETIILCRKGFHASKRAIDALLYAPGSLACLVTLHGETIQDSDKTVAQGRTVLAMADATGPLWEMACWAAEQALQNERELGREPHADSWAAIAARRKWLQNEISDKTLSAADSAAAYAADSAAYYAAAYAADSAARYATRSAQNEQLEFMLHKLLGTKGEK